MSAVNASYFDLLKLLDRNRNYSIKNTRDIITILKEAPNTFKIWHHDTKIRHIEIIKQITLCYEIQRNEVLLLLFFNCKETNTLGKLLL